MAYDIFTFLNNLTRDKVFPDFSLEEVQKTYDPFMINRWISMIEIWIPIVQLLNKHQNLSKVDHFRFLFNVLPKTSVRFNYIKKGKKDNLKEDDKELLMNHFKFGKNDLYCCLEILTEEQIDAIRAMYKSGKTR